MISLVKGSGVIRDNGENFEYLKSSDDGMYLWLRKDGGDVLLQYKHWTQKLQY